MDLRRIIGSFVGSATRGVRTAHPVADYYTRYVGALCERALGSWSAVHAAGVRCGLELEGARGEHALCGSPAIGVCMACGKPVCIGHALVSPEHILCLGCAYAARELGRGRKGPEPEPYRAPRPAWDAYEEGRPFGFVDDPNDQDVKTRLKHLSTLGLAEDATEDEVKEAYRRLARANHPDRAKTDEQRGRRERKLKDLNDAYSWLSAHARRAA